MADFYDNKHYFIEAFDEADQDFQSEHISVQSPKCCSESNQKSEEKGCNLEDFIPKAVQVKADVEPGSSLEPTLQSSSSISIELIEGDENAEFHASVSAASLNSTQDIAILPVDTDSIQSSGDVITPPCASPTPTTCSSQDDARCV